MKGLPKAPEVLHYLISKSRSPCGYFYSPTLQGVRYQACVLPPSYGRLKTSMLAISMYRVYLWKALVLDVTRKHDTPIRNECLGENVYLCPCFCDAPVTRPGNCTWLLWWAVTFIFDPFGSHLATVAVLKDTRHLKDLLRPVLLAGSEAISSDATRAPGEPRCLPIISVRVILCTSHVLKPVLIEMNRHVSMKIHFVAWFYVTSCSLALAPNLYDHNPSKKENIPLIWTDALFCNAM